MNQKIVITILKLKYDIEVTMKVIDPACNMEIEDKWAAYKTEYKGKTYYFCCESCKKRFDESPEKYIS
jgi:YHS domain-containing protein